MNFSDHAHLWTSSRYLHSMGTGDEQMLERVGEELTQAYQDREIDLESLHTALAAALMARSGASFSECWECAELLLDDTPVESLERDEYEEACSELADAAKDEE